MSIVTTTRPSTLAPSRLSEGRVRPARSSSLTSTIDPVRVLRRHVLAIMISLLVGGLLGTAAFYACVMFYPLYSGQVLFEVMPGLHQSTDVSTLDTSNDEMIFRIAQTETYMLTSRPVLVTALKDPDIRKTEWYKKFVKSGSDGIEAFHDEEAVDDLVRTVSTSVIRASNLFSVNWSAHVPTDVPRILNAIEKAYSANRAKRDSAVFERNQKLFEDQLRDTERNLSDLESEMKKLIKTAGLTTPDDSRYSPDHFKQQTFIAQRADSIVKLNMIVTEYQMVSAKLEGLLEPTAEDVLEADRDPIVNSLNLQETNVRGEVRRLRGERNPDDHILRRTEAALKAVEDELNAKRRGVITRNLEGQAKSLSQSLDRFRNAVDKQEDELDKNSVVLKDKAAATSEYHTMQIQREHLQERRNQEMQLIQEVKLMRVRVDAARVRTAQQAQEPRRLSFPQSEIMVPLGVLVALGLTLGVIFLRELLDQRVKSASDLAVLPGAFVLGGIPELEEDPTALKGSPRAAEMVVRKQPFGVLAESYRQVFTAMSIGLERSGHQTLVLVGGLPGAGTTTAATNLACAAAATGKRVLVVDANFRRPRLAQAMEVSGEGPGLGDLLSGAATLDEAIVDAGGVSSGGVSVIPAGTPANRVIERLNNGLFDSMVAELRGRFDLIIFDAPPAVVAGDAMVLANKVDAAVLVVRAHAEHRGLVARMINQLADARCELLGVLLNRPRGTAGGYFKKNYATMAQYATPDPRRD